MDSHGKGFYFLKATYNIITFYATYRTPIYNCPDLNKSELRVLEAYLTLKLNSGRPYGLNKLLEYPDTSKVRPSYAHVLEAFLKERRSPTMEPLIKL